MALTKHKRGEERTTPKEETLALAVVAEEVAVLPPAPKDYDDEDDHRGRDCADC